MNNVALKSALASRQMVLADYSGFSGPSGTSQNVGGHTGRIRMYVVGWATTIPAKTEISDSAATTAAGLINVTTAPTFSSGKGWVESYITRNSGRSKSSMTDVRDSTGSSTEFEGDMPGVTADMLGNLVIANNNKMIAAVELADGTWLLLGSSRFPAEVKFNWESGGNEEGGRKAKVTIKAFETTPQIYTGTFSMHA